MDTRFFGRLSTTFTTFFVMTVAFWWMFALFAPIPDAHSVLIEHTPDGPDVRTWIWTDDTDTSRFWFDLVGIPLLAVATYITVQALRNSWTLPEELWSHVGGALLLACAFTFILVEFGAYLCLTLIALCLLVFLLAAMMKIVVHMLEAMVLKTREKLFNWLRSMGVFLFFTVPLSLCYVAGLAFNGLYGYCMFLLFASMGAIVALLARGVYMGAVLVHSTDKKKETVLT